jgi:hypothetical protein
MAGLAVMKRPLEDLLGGFFRDLQSGILVNTARPPGMVHMTCAHELGHFFLGHESTLDKVIEYDASGQQYEKEADWFAYSLLMPQWLIVNVARQKGWTAADFKNPITLYQLSLRLGTSYTATLWSLVRLGLLHLSASEIQALQRTVPQLLKRKIAPWLAHETISDVWLLNERDKDRVLEPRATDRFVIDLPDHSSSGFLWDVGQAREAGFTLRPITTETPAPGFDQVRNIVVGGLDRQRYALEHSFEPDSVLPEEILKFDFSERQPWRGPESNRDGFKVSAEFESMREGLDAQSRERLLAGVAEA